MLPSRRFRRVLAVTYYNAVIVTENHLRSFYVLRRMLALDASRHIGCQIARKPSF